VRYENLAITAVACLFLFLRGYYTKAIGAFLFVAILLGGFSFFLTRLGLHPVPTSVMTKLSSGEASGGFANLKSNIKKVLENARGLLLILSIVGLVGYGLLAELNGKKRLFAACVALAALMHVLRGRYGWQNRYEIYIWSFVVMSTLFLVGPAISRFLDGENRKQRLVKLLTVACVAVIATSMPYILGIAGLSIGSNNIYEQQYQMHRFAAEFYKKPVAVADLGYVSYKNDNYILDLGGLASLEAFQHRQKKDKIEWISNLADKYGVDFAIVYQATLGNNPPKEFIKVAEMHLGKIKVAPDEEVVMFYARNEKTKAEVIPELREFAKTLPSDVKFVISE
jgi:hypothetical protein